MTISTTKGGETVKRERYEISVWEDYLVPKSGDTPAHYEERKVAVLGSDRMRSSIRAIEPKLVENINQTNTFTFKMFYRLPRDFEETDLAEHQMVMNHMDVELKENPLLDYLFPEAKIKLYWKGRWYNLVIKSTDENSEEKSITYTCIDNYVNELSRTGFNIVFDKQLENSTGTAAELASRVLKGSDWSVDLEKTELLQEWIEDAVFEVATVGDIVATAEHKSGESETIPSGSKILVYYQQLQELLSANVESGVAYIQFAYSTNYEQENYSMLVTNDTCYSAEMSWSNVEGVITLTKGGSIVVDTKSNLSMNYRAKRLVRSQEMRPDEDLGRYVGVYRNRVPVAGLPANSRFLGYSRLVFEDATLVENLLVNGRDFSNTRGWEGNDLFLRTYPLYDEIKTDTDFPIPYLRMARGQTYYNATFQVPGSEEWSELKRGQKYILRYKAKSGKEPTSYVSGGLEFAIREYSQGVLHKEIKEDGIEYMTVGEAVVNGNWVEHTVTVVKNVNKKNMKHARMGLFMFVKTEQLWLEEMQLFNLVYTEENGTQIRINPQDFDLASIGREKFTYYQKNGKTINYLWEAYEDWEEAQVEPVYVPNFEKIRTIEEKNSNRFNLLQTIAETFECWVKFEVLQDESTGRLYYDSEGKPVKRVYFVRDIGEDTGVSFVHGIDLKGIQRNTDTSEITTKTIVPPVVSEFAEHGFCAIARAHENYPKVNYILNFDYYVAQGLINREELLRDLYEEEGLNLYNKLRERNKLHQAETDKKVVRSLELARTNSLLETYNGLTDQLREEIQRLQSEIIDFLDAESWADAELEINRQGEKVAREVKRRVETIKSLERVLIEYVGQREKIEISVSRLEGLVEDSEELLGQIEDEIREIEDGFFDKYSRFLQEGVWPGEGYVDDDRYYLDAQAVATTSGYPKVGYNISVLRLSFLKEFENKKFHLGDIARVEDREFLGTTVVDGLKTPIRQKVLISELTSFLDESDKDVITVQNYRSQFEDLFQRITATVQSLKFPSGESRRVAGGVSTAPSVVSGPTLSLPDVNIIEGGSFEAPDLLWNFNQRDIWVGQVEEEVGFIETEIVVDTSAQAHLQLVIEATKATEVLVRIYDNEAQELYSPIVKRVRQGINEIGIPHSHTNLRSGDHNFRVTLQTREGEVLIRPRGVMYTIEVFHNDIAPIGLLIEDVSIRQPEFATEPTELYVIGRDEEERVIVSAARFQKGIGYRGTDFTPQYEILAARQAKSLAIEFNGVFKLDRSSGADKFSLVTETEPRIFWVNENNELWTQIGGASEGAFRLAEEALQVSAVRGWNSDEADEEKDFGLVVAYLKYNGEIWYRRLMVNSVGELAWRAEEQLEEAGSGNLGVRVARLNDYRMVFAVEGINKAFVTEPIFVGMASPKEYVGLTARVEKDRTVFTAIPTKDAPYNLVPEVDLNDGKDILLTANYNWVIRDNKLTTFDVITNTSGANIDNVYVDENNQKVLHLVLSKKVDYGKLIIKPNTIIGKHDNGCWVELKETIEVFDIIMKSKTTETVQLDARVENVGFEVFTMRELKELAPTETVQLDARIEDVQFEVYALGVLKTSAPTETVQLNARVEAVDFEHFFVGEIIG